VKVGLNKITLKAAGKILKGRCLYNNKPAPACGLCLYQVKYETVTSPAINRALEL